MNKLPGQNISQDLKIYEIILRKLFLLGGLTSGKALGENHKEINVTEEVKEKAKASHKGGKENPSTE